MDEALTKMCRPATAKSLQLSRPSVHTLLNRPLKMRTDTDLSKIINQSGFPLQLVIDRLIGDRSAQLGWKVLYREHGWRSPDGQSGFVDLVLENNWGTSVLVIECKRVLDADWIFLEELPTSLPSTRVRLWATNTPKYGKEHSGYYDAAALPESPESMYCVVAGQDAKSRPMLERVASEVSSAMEAIAVEELSVITKRGYGLRMYVSVIVTTARIVVSQIDPKLVSLKDGEASSIKHQVQPWVRFRKQFSPEFAVEPKNPEWSFSELAAAKEKIVFVVNAESLPEFLSKWEIEKNSLRALF